MDERLYDVEIYLNNGRKIDIRTVAIYKDTLVDNWSYISRKMEGYSPIVRIQNFNATGKYVSDVLINVRLITDIWVR